MEFTKLSNRLDLVASFVPAGARLLDVGSDHAYLPIALLQEGKIEAAIAGEVVEGPYQSALQNVADNGLEDKIEVRLAWPHLNQRIVFLASLLQGWADA